MKPEAYSLATNGVGHDDEAISERIVISLPKSLLQDIQDYRFGGRINSQSAAVRHLIQCGLKAERGRKLA
jgi:metal-responsive CopG/Arc/MetJ family transcriptional regulator